MDASAIHAGFVLDVTDTDRQTKSHLGFDQYGHTENKDLMNVNENVNHLVRTLGQTLLRT